jgi:type VI secretion system protein ImpF
MTYKVRAAAAAVLYFPHNINWYPMNAAPTGSLMPLFDRLSGDLPASADGRVLDAGGLQQSLRRDLIRLFNARNGLTIDQFLANAHTSLQYGMPDTLGLSPHSASDLERWGLVTARAIALYEPRLSDVRVQVSADRSSPMVARVNIGAAVALGRQLCQVHFEVMLDGQAASLAIVA